jgi:hypothetical protein
VAQDLLGRTLCPFDRSTHRHIVFDSPIAVGTAQPTHQCNFWDSLEE